MNKKMQVYSYNGSCFEDHYDVFDEGDEFCYFVEGRIWFSEHGDIIDIGSRLEYELNCYRAKLLQPKIDRKDMKGLKRKNEVK